jgi:hypothetical protein
MIMNEANYLEHHGVKGMKWGQRKTARIQTILDRHQRIAEGIASRHDKLLGVNRFIFTKKGASRTLQRGANNQAKLNAKLDAGKLGVQKVLFKNQVARMKVLDFHKQGDAKAKMDSGQKAAAAFIIALGGVQIARAVKG